MTTQTLDEIMSGRGDAVLETETTPEPQAPETNTEGPARDGSGRFAPKAGETDTAQQPDAEHEPDEPRKGGSVPQQALHASRERERTAREEAQALRDQVQRLEGMIMASTRSQEPAKPVEQLKTVDFWEDPQAFIQQALTPFQQEMQQQREQMSATAAIQQHGKETVDAAYQAMGTSLASDPRVQADYQRIMKSAHPYDELVTWHRNRQALSEIGNDPNAYRERLRQELMAELQQSTTQAQPAAAPKLPGNFATARSEGPRSGATYTGPKPLSEILKGSNA